MKLKDAIMNRQSIRHYKEGMVAHNDILEMISAAGKAPSAKNAQNWHFIIIKNREIMIKIADIILEKGNLLSDKMESNGDETAQTFRKFILNFGTFFLRAPVIVLVYTSTNIPSRSNELNYLDYDEENYDLILKRDPAMLGLGAAIENFILTAESLGYGACLISAHTYAIREIESLIRKEINFGKEGYFLGPMFSLGIPEDNPKSPAKKPIEEIYTIIN